MSAPQKLLAALPREIIEFVAEHLSLADLRSVRLVCKALAEKSSYYVSHIYCTKVKTNLSLASIQRLEAISQSTWARHVRSILLCWDEEAGHGVSWDRGATGAILASSRPIQQVRDCILRFTNCHIFHIGSLCGDQSRIPKKYPLRCSDLIGIGLMLIAETGMSLHTLSIWFGDEFRPSWVYPSPVFQEQVMRPTFRSAVATLEKLNLHLDLEDKPSSKHQCKWLWDIVSHATLVRRLKLRVYCSDVFYSKPTGFSNVQELRFEDMGIPTTNLTQILQQCRHCLRFIILSRVLLDDGWQSLFLALRDCKVLEHIYLRFRKRHSMFNILQCLQDAKEELHSTRGKLQLAWEDNEGTKTVVAVDCSGFAVQNVIQTLINARAD